MSDSFWEELRTDIREWRKISGLRDVLIHQYFRLNTEILQDVVENKIPNIESCIDKPTDKN